MIIYSIIIPTRNRASNLRSLLKSIAEQENEDNDIEVIIIDNYSTDNTAEVFEEFVNFIPNLRYLKQEKIGLHFARNHGIKHSNGEILCYLDDDVYLSKFWLKGIKKSFTDKNIVLVSGKNLPLFEAKPLTLVGSQWNSSKKENITGYLGILDLGDEEKEIDPLLVYGCNFSIRKKILLEAGGFHPDGFPQDLCKYRGDGETYISQFVKNLGSKTWYSPIVSVAHLVSMEKTTLKYYRKRSFNQGISDSFTYIRSIKGNHLKIFNKLILDLFRFIKCLILFNITTYKKYHLLGIIYHQINCLKDKSLMQYVLKENYLE